MKLSHLEEFIEIARAQSISEAAKNLYLTHQALSKHLLDIEQEIGCPLFTRGVPLQLTAAGEAFLDSSAVITAEYRMMLQTINRLKSEKPGRVRVLIFDNIPFPNILASAIRNLHEKRPNISVEFQKETHISCEQALVEGKVDLGWHLEISKEANPPVPEDDRFCFTRLESFRDILQFGVSNKHPLALKRERAVTLKELSMYPIVVPTFNSKNMLPLAVEKLFTNSGLTPHFTFMPSSNLDEFHMKVSPLGVYPLPEGYCESIAVPSYFTDNITVIKPADATLFITAYCMTPKQTQNEALQPFLDEFVAAQANTE